jgi:Fe-Mn family superoxide dismutase
MNTAVAAMAVGEQPPAVAAPYSFKAVQGLSRKALDLHLELYRGYVKQVNSLQAQLAQQRSPGMRNDPALQLQRAGLVQRSAFERNGMYLHELFFEQLDGQPAGPAPSPGSVLMEAMDISFGGSDGWRADIEQLADTRGSGWVLSARHADSNQLANFWIADHHLGVPIGMRPIAVFDLWEHAYLLDFPVAARREYLGVLFRNTDWSVLERRMLA